MHEVAAMQRAVKTVLEQMQQAGADGVKSVELVIGASGHFTEDAARQNFKAMAAGTPAERAELTISWLPATFQCLSCQTRFESIENADEVACPKCGGAALQIEHRDDCYVSSIEVTFAETAPEK